MELWTMAKGIRDQRRFRRAERGRLQGLVVTGQAPSRWRRATLLEDSGLPLRAAACGFADLCDGSWRETEVNGLRQNETANGNVNPARP